MLNKRLFQIAGLKLFSGRIKMLKNIGLYRKFLFISKTNIKLFSFPIKKFSTWARFKDELNY